MTQRRALQVFAHQPPAARSGTVPNAMIAARTASHGASTISLVACPSVRSIVTFRTSSSSRSGGAHAGIVFHARRNMAISSGDVTMVCNSLDGQAVDVESVHGDRPPGSIPGTPRAHAADAPARRTGPPTSPTRDHTAGDRDHTRGHWAPPDSAAACSALDSVQYLPCAASRSVAADPSSSASAHQPCSWTSASLPIWQSTTLFASHRAEPDGEETTRWACRRIASGPSRLAWERPSASNARASAGTIDTSRRRRAANRVRSHHVDTMTVSGRPTSDRQHDADPDDRWARSRVVGITKGSPVARRSPHPDQVREVPEGDAGARRAPLAR